MGQRGAERNATDLNTADLNRTDLNGTGRSRLGSGTEWVAWHWVLRAFAFRPMPCPLLHSSTLPLLRSSTLPLLRILAPDQHVDSTTEHSPIPERNGRLFPNRAHVPEQNSCSRTQLCSLSRTHVRRAWLIFTEHSSSSLSRTHVL